jgi:soluble lytic murein transglycosylase-like protein
MSEGTVFQSVERVLLRIEEIKRRFGVQRTSGRSDFQQILEQQKEKSASEESRKITYDDIIKAASDRYKIPQELIKAVIKQESNFKEDAVSNKGAVGMMQLMPQTSDVLGVEDPFDAEQNIFGGTQYLRHLIDLYGGNLNKALAAYNAGPNRVDSEIPNIPETLVFIESVLDNYNKFSKSEE